MKTDETKRKTILDSLISGEVSSVELMGKSRELVIVHNHERYLMRITSNNKLILTK